MEIEVMDNGIGRIESAKIKTTTSNHTSYAIATNMDRIKLVNINNDVVVTDLYDNQIATGTSVTIHLKN